MSYNEVQYFEGFTNNIYNSCVFQRICSCNQRRGNYDHFLVASQTTLHSLDFVDGSYNLRELSLSGVPDDAKLVAIDVFPAGLKKKTGSSTRSAHYNNGGDDCCCENVYCVTYNYPSSSNRGGDHDLSHIRRQGVGARLSPAAHRHKNTPSDELSSGLNFYSSNVDDLSSFNESLAKKLTSDYQHLNLNFFPGKLTHLMLRDESNLCKPILLLAGKDERVHFYGHTSVEHASSRQDDKLGFAPTSAYPLANAEGASEHIADGRDRFKSPYFSSISPDEVSQVGIVNEYNRDFPVAGVEDAEIEDEEDADDYYLFGDASKADSNRASTKQLDSEEIASAKPTGQITVSFSEINNQTMGFSGLTELPSLALSLKTLQNGNPESPLMAVGCGDGTLRMIQLLTRDGLPEDSKVLSESKLKGPLPVVDFLKNGKDYDLVVGGSLGFAAVFPKISGRDSGTMDLLPTNLYQSNSPNSVLCIHTADFNCDGQEEIAIGTYEQEMLVYQRVSRSDSMRLMQEKDEPCEFSLLWKRRFVHPVYSIKTGDFNLDGAKEIVVNSLHGIHILQPDMHQLADKILLGVGKMSQLEELMENVIP